MENYVYGYARVSTETQNLDRQLDQLEKYGVDEIYNDNDGYEKGQTRNYAPS